jgi:hypothetical protein
MALSNPLFKGSSFSRYRPSHFLFISVAAFYRIEALIAIFQVARITVPEVALLLVSSLSPLIIAVLIAKLVKPLKKGMVSVYDLTADPNEMKPVREERLQQEHLDILERCLRSLKDKSSSGSASGDFAVH